MSRSFNPNSGKLALSFLPKVIFFFNSVSVRKLSFKLKKSVIIHLQIISFIEISILEKWFAKSPTQLEQYKASMKIDINSTVRKKEISKNKKFTSRF